MNQLAKFLPDYSMPLALADVNFESVFADPPAEDTALITEKTEQLIQDAYAQGKADAELELASRHAENIEHIQMEFNEHLLAEKQRWIEDESIKISAEFQNALTHMQIEFGKLVCRALTPFLKKKISAMALSQTEELLISALDGREKVHLKISGPDDLVAALKTKTFTENATFEMNENTEAEVQASCDEFAITTQINFWLHKLEAIGLNTDV
jgi:hypothetical protein